MQPIFTANRTPKQKKRLPAEKPRSALLYVEPRPYMRRVQGAESWFGTSGALARGDKVDPRMRLPTYGSGCLEGYKVTDEDVISTAKIYLGDAKMAKFSKGTTVKRADDTIGKLLTLAVYSSESDTRLFFVDAGICEGPETLYAPESLEPVKMAMNAAAIDDATLLVMPFSVEENDRAYKSAVRKLNK